MSHAEIWDDSALVDSWNDALQEYKHYHSLHARGEKIEDVLQAHQVNGSAEKDMKDASMKTDGTERVLEDGMNTDTYEGDIQEDAEKAASSLQGPEFEDKLSLGEEVSAAKQNGTTLPAGPPLPHHLIGSVRDEALKTLLMSWYYAGYYTGLYEGQQIRKSSEGGKHDGSG